jgi:hypothetical protein
MAVSHMQFEVFCNCGLPSLYSEKMICIHTVVMWFNIFCKKRSQTCTGRNRGFHTVFNLVTVLKFHLRVVPFQTRETTEWDILQKSGRDVTPLGVAGLVTSCPRQCWFTCLQLHFVGEGFWGFLQLLWSSFATRGFVQASEEPMRQCSNYLRLCPLIFVRFLERPLYLLDCGCGGIECRKIV